jgi:hypothetical protein
MSPGRREAVGVLIVIVGCVWFAFSTIWMPPLTILCLWLTSANMPDIVGAVLIRCDYVIPAFIAATGFVIKRSAYQKPTKTVFAVAYGTASAFVFAVLVLWGFIRLRV